MNLADDLLAGFVPGRKRTSASRPDLTARVATLYAQFASPGITRCSLCWEAPACGCHASAVPTANGQLGIRGPWESF